MTYLEIMNAVAARLRRPSLFTEVTGTDEQTRLYAEAVNDAKRRIEAAHDWRVLDRTVEIQTVAGVSEYPLTDIVFTDRWSLQYAHNLTTSGELFNIPKEEMDRQRNLSSSSNGQPGEYIIKPPVNPNWNTPRIEFFPTPDATYVINLYVNAPQANLAANTDTPLVSPNLVVQGAYATLYAERGEAVSAGPMLGNPIKQFEDSLHDAISRDQELQGEEVGFYVQSFGTNRE